MKLSKQSITVFMVLLQKCLLEEKDITDLLLDLKFGVDVNNELFVKNPPKNIQVLKDSK